MSAVEAFKAARAAGVQLGVDGDELVVEASVQPPAAVIALLSRHKAEVVVLLRPAEDGWSAEDWQSGRRSRTRRALLGIEGRQSAHLDTELARKD